MATLSCVHLQSCSFCETSPCSRKSWERLSLSRSIYGWAMLESVGMQFGNCGGLHVCHSLQCSAFRFRPGLLGLVCRVLLQINQFLLLLYRLVQWVAPRLPRQLVCALARTKALYALPFARRSQNVYTWHNQADPRQWSYCVCRTGDTAGRFVRTNQSFSTCSELILQRQQQWQQLPPFVG